MSLDAHMESLHAKHSFLENLICEEMQRPSPDFKTLTELKKRKLMIKEQISTNFHSDSLIAPASA